MFRLNVPFLGGLKAMRLLVTNRILGAAMGPNVPSIVSFGSTTIWGG
jgi:hypothetical protein